MKHIKTETTEQDGGVLITVELFYKEKRKVSLLIDKSRFDEMDLNNESF